MKKHFLFILWISAAGFAQDKPTAVHAGDGITVNSYDYAGFESALQHQDDSIYVINFWATWCAPCVKELPNFEKLQQTYKGKNVKVMLVSLDMSKQVESALIPFIKKKKLQSEVIHLHDPDANAWISKVDASWSGALPATVIYNKDKRKFYEQSFTYEELENEVQQFIN